MSYVFRTIWQGFEVRDLDPTGKVGVYTNQYEVFFNAKHLYIGIYMQRLNENPKNIVHRGEIERRGMVIRSLKNLAGTDDIFILPVKRENSAKKKILEALEFVPEGSMILLACANEDRVRDCLELLKPETLN